MENKGDDGSLLCTSISCLLSTKPFLIAFCMRLTSAGLNNCSGLSSSVDDLLGNVSSFEISICAT